MGKRGLLSGISSVCALMLCTNCGPSDSSPTKQGGEGVLETAELTVPIPSGYRSVSKEELAKRDAKKTPITEAAATLERAGHSRIAVMRVPRSSDHDGTPPTSEKCVRMATEFATQTKESVVVGGTLIEHSAEGLGRSCQFTVAWGRNQFTHTVAAEWSVLCIHPSGEGAVCQTVAAGLRRKTGV